ncbi:sensor histidine kinase [Aliikangiella maris]|uniref:histidine kinase n=2 Tax=Aliikangiella maris TaxID=3162458 RepID=A0ABV2BQ01_9GAMM
MFRLNLTKARIVFIIFFTALVIPTIILGWQAYQQFRWKAFHQFQREAQLLTGKISQSLLGAIKKEEQRSDIDYGFLVLAGDPKAGFVQRSELSKFPVESQLPGVIGYFQVDENGRFSTPLLPDDLNNAYRYGISETEKLQRLQLANQLHQILSQNQLVNTNANVVSELNASEPNRHLSTQSTMGLSDSRQAAPMPSRAAESMESTLPQYEPAAGKQEAEQIEMSLEESATEADLVHFTPQAGIKYDKLLPSSSRSLDAKKAEQKVIHTPEGLSNFDQLQSELLQTQLAEDIGQPVKKESFSKKIQAKKEALKLQKAELAVRESAQSIEITGSRVEKNYQLQPRQKESRLQSSSLQQTDNQTSYQQHDIHQDSLEELQVNLFESKLEPYRFSLLSGRHFVLYRQVWRNNKRLVQGMLLSVDDFLAGTIRQHFTLSLLAEVSSLNIIYGKQLIQTYQGKEITNYSKRLTTKSLNSNEPLQGEVLYLSALNEPFNRLTMVFNVTRMPVGTGAGFIVAIILILLFVITLGTYWLYHLALKQIALIQQQQNFVSSVSHELKTPLTSIRMCGEILQQGWASDEKKKTYYEYIFNESERLSRLIDNVLTLSKTQKQSSLLETSPVEVRELIDLILSKTHSQIEANAFELSVDVDEKVKQYSVMVDKDRFLQVIINLIDNAIKYSAKSELKRIDMQCNLDADEQLVFSIRDYGPGIAKQHLNKVFQLFYRATDELTRESQGTGIGLALVKELTEKMSIKVKVKNREPGVCFSLIFNQVVKSNQN